MSSTNVRNINEDAQFQTELEQASAADRYVIADFTAKWCAPCRRAAPIFEEFSKKYPNAVFLKVDVDRCQETAVSQGITAMPTFVIYKNCNQVDCVKGCNMNSLDEKIQHLVEAEEAANADPQRKHPSNSLHTTPIADTSSIAQIALNAYISFNGSECLNQSDVHSMVNCLKPEEDNQQTCLRSDCDNQLILSIAFKQNVKIHSLKFKAPADIGPKHIKLFINQPNTLDFESAENMSCVQELQLTPDQLAKGELVNLRYVKFQNVMNLQLFVRDNQNGENVTQLDYLGIYGAPVVTTLMKDFKRISGTAGESH